MNLFQRFLLLTVASAMLELSSAFSAGLSRSQPCTALPAVIYQPDWENEDSPNSVIREEEDNTPIFGSFFSSTIEEHRDLADFIHRGSMDSLARLAVVFSQADRKLELKDIETVEILGMDRDHINIQAVLCEDDGCVTLAVPISFPRPCDAGDFRSCVLDNLQVLDGKAHGEIRQKQWEDDNHEDISAAQRQMRALRDPTGLELPGWWVSEGTMASECKFLKDLLNEDEFEEEIKALALYEMKQTLWSQVAQVNQAAVATVGPPGLMLRARYTENGQPKIVEVPVAFSQPCHDSSSLRAAVLGAVTIPSVPTEGR